MQSIFWITDISATLQSNARSGLHKLGLDLRKASPRPLLPTLPQPFQISITQNSPVSGSDSITFCLTSDSDGDQVPDVANGAIVWDTDNPITISLDPVNEQLLRQVPTAADTKVLANNVREPLGRVVSFAQMLEEDYGALSEEEIQSYLHVVVRRGREIVGIVDALLAVRSELPAEAAEDLVPLDMDSVMIGVLYRVAHLVDEHEAEIVTPDSWPAALGHAAWLDWPWKLHRIDDGEGRIRLELYNLERDPGETDDLAERAGDRTASMTTALEVWQRSVLYSLSGRDYR